MSLPVLRDSELVIRALTHPEGLSEGWAGDLKRSPEAWVAVLFARPDLIPKDAAEKLRPWLASPEQAACADALRFLLFSDAAPGAIRVALDALRSSEASDGLRLELLEVLREGASWRPELLQLDGLVAIFRAARSDSERSVAGAALESLLCTAPEAFSRESQKEARELLATMPRFRYLARPEDPPPPAAPVGEPGFRLLVAVNSLFGQGDEILRTAALLQAVLDANPGAEIVVLTRRTYLYDHTRVEARSILEDAAVQRVTAQHFDGVVHFREPRAAHFNWNPLAMAAVEATIRRLKPRLLVRGDHVDQRFGFQTAAVDGRDLAKETYDLLTHNLYAPTFRLLFDLGLPIRLGEQPAGSPWALTGVPSEDAGRIWGELTGGERPVALVNPFGGARPAKGYTRHHFGQLAGELVGLVEEGYRVVMLPNGTTWGSRSEAEAVAKLLPDNTKERVAIAPDPGELHPGRRVRLTERPELDHPDRVMRLFKYFTARADLIVTVEGWMSHLAYSLGRPFRLVLMAHSPPRPWYPLGRGPNQRLATEMSPLARVDYRSTDRLSGASGTPFPRLHRKRMLEVLLKACGHIGGDEPLNILEKILASADPDLRRLAVESLGRRERAARILRRTLGDPDGTVRAAAAGGLLALGEGPSDLMRAHIAVANRDWPTLDRLGTGAWQALAAASADPNATIRDEVLQAAARRLWPWQAKIGISRRLAQRTSSALLWAAKRICRTRG